MKKQLQNIIIAACIIYMTLEVGRFFIDSSHPADNILYVAVGITILLVFVLRLFHSRMERKEVSRSDS